MQDLTAILIYGNGRHVRPWGFGKGVPSICLQTSFRPPPPSDSNCPVEVEFQLLILGFSSPDSTPGRPQPSQNSHLISVPGSVQGTGDTEVRQTQLPPTRSPSFLVSALRNNASPFPSTAVHS